MAQSEITRRRFFERFSDGIHGTALAMLLSSDFYGSVGPLMASEAEPELPEGHRRAYDFKPRPPHFLPRAKAVIHLFMGGGQVTLTFWTRNRCWRSTTARFMTLAP